VVQDLFDKPKWTEILGKIETGRRQWLDVAVKLYAGTDAGSTEELALAVGVALLHQPRQVLLQVAPVLGIEEVCSSPDIDDPSLVYSREGDRNSRRSHCYSDPAQWS
jgi:hypothetical protein